MNNSKKKIIIKNNERELIKEFIINIKKIILKKTNKKKRFSFVVTGGSSPINLYKDLGKSKIKWSKIDFFWSDERMIKNSSKDSNLFYFNKYIFKKNNINKNQIFAIDYIKGRPNISNNIYKKKIKSYFKNKKAIFDLVLLGMGNDGHIASIFSKKQIHSKNKEVSSYVRKGDFHRVTLNLKTINDSKNIFLWLPNEEKSLIYSLIRKNKKNNAAVNYLKKSKTCIYKIKNV